MTDEGGKTNTPLSAKFGKGQEYALVISAGGLGAFLRGPYGLVRRTVGKGARGRHGLLCRGDLRPGVGHDPCRSRGRRHVEVEKVITADAARPANRGGGIHSRNRSPDHEAQLPAC